MNRLTEFEIIKITDFLYDYESVSLLYIVRMHNTPYYKIKKYVNTSDMHIMKYKITRIYYDCGVDKLPKSPTCLIFNKLPRCDIN